MSVLRLAMASPLRSLGRSMPSSVACVSPTRDRKNANDGSGALLVDLFILIAVAIKLVAQAGADTERDGGGAAALGPVLMVGRALVAGFLWVAQGADVAAGRILEEVRFIGEGVAQRHRETGLA